MSITNRKVKSFIRKCIRVDRLKLILDDHEKNKYDEPYDTYLDYLARVVGQGHYKILKEHVCDALRIKTELSKLPFFILKNFSKAYAADVDTTEDKFVKICKKCDAYVDKYFDKYLKVIEDYWIEVNRQKLRIRMNSIDKVESVDN